MRDLPMVAKPYLTLDETLIQLKKAGAKLNKPEDILVIAANKELNVNLILELSSDIMLIEEKHVRALVKKIPASEYSYGVNELNDAGFTSEDINEFREEIEGVDWLVVTNDASMKAFDMPRAFTPKDVCFDVNTEVLKISNSRFWLSDSPKPEKLSALEIDGVTYFIVKDLTGNPLFRDVERTHEENGYDGIKYCLDENSIEAIIESNSYVVTREEMLAYEERKRDSLKGIAHTKAHRKRSTVHVSDLYNNLSNSPIASMVQQMNLFELGGDEKYVQLFMWKGMLTKKLFDVRGKYKYEFEKERTKDITGIKSSLHDIAVLLDDKLLVSSDADDLKNNNPVKSSLKLIAKDGVNDSRIKDLRIYISELVVRAKNKGVELDPLDLPCSKDMLLSDIKRWERSRVPIKAERNWEVGHFPKKTWEHVDRENICNNFRNRNNTPSTDFFKKINSE